MNKLNKLNFNDKTQKTLKELEKTSSDFWNIAPETANFLNMLIKIKGAKNVLEIGTSNGYSGIWIAKALKITAGKLTTIEFWDNRQNLAIENFKTCEVHDIITPKLGSALEIIPKLKEEFDFIFIDANKKEYIKYFEQINPLLIKGGIIACDNITSHAKKVADFVEAIESHPEYQVEILDLPSGLLLAYKI